MACASVRMDTSQDEKVKLDAVEDMASFLKHCVCECLTVMSMWGFNCVSLSFPLALSVLLSNWIAQKSFSTAVM